MYPFVHPFIPSVDPFESPYPALRDPSFQPFTSSPYPLTSSRQHPLPALPAASDPVNQEET
jgi:hypothetical protein